MTTITAPTQPAEFRLTCEEYGITVPDLARKFAQGRTDNIRKWWKTQRPTPEAVTWVTHRVARIHELAEKMIATAEAEHQAGGDHLELPELITFRTDRAVTMFHGVDPELNALQHRAAARIAARHLQAQGVPFAVSFWEDALAGVNR